MSQEESRELVIAHTFADGTTLTGTRRSDDLYRLLRSHGWLYRRSVGDYRLQGSVDRPAKRGAIDRTAVSLRERGFAVRVEIDDTPRPVAEAEADRAERAMDRAERLRARKARLTGQAEGRHRSARQVLDHIPPGQPYLVDSSGYAADRRRRERAIANEQAAFDLQRRAEAIGRQAETAERHMDFRYSPETVANRIRGLEADLRGIDREREDARTRQELLARGVPADRVGGHAMTPERDAALTAQAAHLGGQLDHWRGVRERQLADGTAPNITRDDVTVGDLVRYHRTWYPVVRVNRLSVTVPTILGGSWTDTVRYERLSDHVRPSDDRWDEVAALALATAQAMSNTGRVHQAFEALRPG